ncbi:hypothetical protein [Nocardioides sp. YIM 152588]|uniref:hypothetical protein n=1 Tax=Nocardioides sp. YIM 152588 TaxID=3158259 RepID=UPI0032E3CF63
MGMDGEFGRDTDAIKSWLAKRASYTDDESLPGVGDADAIEADTTVRLDDEPQPAHAEPAEPTSAFDPLSEPLRDTLPTAPPAFDEAFVEPAVDEPALDATAIAPSAPTWTAPRPTTPQWSGPERPRRGSTADIEFTPRVGGRWLATVLTLVAFVGAGAAGYLAFHEPTATRIGFAAGLGLIALVAWAAHVGAGPVELAVNGGKLEVRQGGRTRVYDLASPYTPVAVVGRPGRRGWKVLVEQAGEPVLTVNASMVDPVWFSDVLYRLRPDLREPAARPVFSRR